MKLFLRFFTGCFFITLAFSAAAQNSTNIFTVRRAPPIRPSIIFIQCHGLGYGDLSCYGQTNFQTPNLDRLAAEGTRFENYFAASTNFTRQLFALMTGKISGASLINVAQLLKSSGYRTGLFGEWTLGAQPWTQGFDDFAGFVNDDEARNYFPEYLWRFAPHSVVNETNNVVSDFSGREMLYPNTGGKKGDYLPDLFIKAELNFIRGNVPDQFNKFRPFFLLMDFPAPRSATAGADDFPVPSDAPFSDEPWPQAAKNRAALITRLDGGIGQLFEQLEKLRLTNNVAIFFTSDAPPEKFANTNLDFLAPNGIQPDKNKTRLPMIVWWPKKIPAGKVSDANWSAADFLPTLAELLRAKLPEKTDGVSALPIWFGRTETNAPPQKF